MYTMRDSNGIMTGKVADEVAVVAMTECKGHHETVERKNGKVNLFVFEEDMKIGNSEFVTLMAWKGNTLEKTP